MRTRYWAIERWNGHCQEWETVHFGFETREQAEAIVRENFSRSTVRIRVVKH